jgi:uncharacterized membrane protein
VTLRDVVRWGLALLMLVAGVGHLLITEEFLGQVPSWLPLRTPIVIVSGLVEIAFAVALVATRGVWRRRVGWALAAFYVMVFPGNLFQAIDGTVTFGLDTDAERWGRLLLQPVLIVAALYATGVLSRRRSPS